MTKPQSPAWWLYRGCRYWLHWPVDSMAQHSGDFRPHSPCCIISYWNCYTSLQPSPKIQWFCSKYTRTRVSDSILTNTDLPYLDKCSSAQTKQSEEYLSLSKLQRKKKKKEEIIPHLWFFFGLIFYPNEWGAIQRDLNRVKQWAHVNFMIFNKSKGKVSYQGYGNLC